LSALVYGRILQAHDVLPQGGSELLVLLSMADKANNDGTGVFMSMATLAKEARVSVSQARRLVHKLRDDGWLELTGERRVKGRNFYVNVYRIKVERLGFTPSTDARGSTDATPSNISDPPLAPMRDDPKDEPSNTPPNPPQGGNSRRGPITITRFLANCKEAGEVPVPDGDPVFSYAESIDLPVEWLHLCWLEFVERHRDGHKRYRSWRRAFLNCVRGNWYRIWYAGDDGTLHLSSQGKIAEKRHADRRAA